MVWDRFWVLGLSVLLWACTTRSPEAAAPTTTGSLAERLSARIRQLSPNAQVVQRGPLHLHVKTDTEHDLYLDNLSAYCNTSPDGCDQRLETFAQMTVNGFGEKLDIRKVLPTLKNRKYVEHAKEGLFGLTANDSYDSARFLLHEQWRSLEQHVGGPLVVAPLGRDIVLFSSSTSKPGLDALRLVLLAETKEPSAAYPITTQPYLWTADGWKPFELPRP
jgi:hypothetical protein